MLSFLFFITIFCFTFGARSVAEIKDCLGENDPKAYISTECITTLVTDRTSNSVVNFDSPTWSASRFLEYLKQDGLFLKDYHLVITHLDSLCRQLPTPRSSSFLPPTNQTGRQGPGSGYLNPKNRPGNSNRLSDDWADALYNWMYFRLNNTRYETRYGIPVPLDTVPYSDYLTNYINHYLSQTTCADMIASIIPCQCSYPPVASAVWARISSGRGQVYPLPSNLGRETWLNDNIEDFGSCHLLWGAYHSLNVSIFPIKAYRGAYQWELRFWGLPNILKY